ncbi:hypothetical protein FTX61_04710 [Nitriliruptoraceae bacterium ZYF776]|nr:hypothetical protein [Profundirhabdus halotolerans]
MPEQPDRDHARPDGLTDAAVAAGGKVTEAYEWVIRARGRLYDFHQMMGRADAILGEGVEELRGAGFEELAEELERTWVGRNALPDRWTFEIVEGFDDTYWDPATAGVRRVRDEVFGGTRHVHESEMKAERRADGPSDDR